MLAWSSMIIIIIDQIANPEIAPISPASLTAVLHISLRCWKCPEGLLKVVELVRKFRGWKVVVGHGSLAQAAQGEPLTQNAAVMHEIPSHINYHKLHMQKTWMEMRQQPTHFHLLESQMHDDVESYGICVWELSSTHYSNNRQCRTPPHPHRETCWWARRTKVAAQLGRQILMDLTT